MKFLIKVGYYCPEVKHEPRWLIVDENIPPKLGVINREPFAAGPLPNHDCAKYYNSQICDSDTACNWQQILEIRPYSANEARSLGLQSLEANTLESKL